MSIASLGPVTDTMWRRLFVLLTFWLTTILFWAGMSILFVPAAALREMLDLAGTVLALAHWKLMVMQLLSFLAVFGALGLLSAFAKEDDYEKAKLLNLDEMLSLCANFAVIFFLAMLITISMAMYTKTMEWSVLWSSIAGLLCNLVLLVPLRRLQLRARHRIEASPATPTIDSVVSMSKS